MAHNGIQINGWLGTILSGLLIVLLGAAVIGIWTMNGTMHEISTNMEWLKNQVSQNTRLILNMMGGR